MYKSRGPTLEWCGSNPCGVHLESGGGGGGGRAWGGSVCQGVLRGRGVGLGDDDMLTPTGYPPQYSSRHGPQRTQHTASTATTPRYPQGRRQITCGRAGPTQSVYGRARNIGGGGRDIGGGGGGKRDTAQLLPVAVGWAGGYTRHTHTYAHDAQAARKSRMPRASLRVQCAVAYT